METVKYNVYFHFKGKEESQLIESIIREDGNPLRYKLLIDMAIKNWADSHKVQIIATEITDIKVFNAENKFVAEQTLWSDYNTITDFIISWNTSLTIARVIKMQF